MNIKLNRKSEKKMNEIEEPEWTAEIMNRESGDTTFEICGWCEHTASGTARYGCMLTSNCALLRQYGYPSGQMSNKWDTPCHLRKLGRKDMDALSRYHNEEIKSAERRIEQIKKDILSLQRLQMELKDKPPLPDNRKIEHHVIGDRCYVFYEDRWNPGVVVRGYRTFDGCVSYVLDDYPESKGGEKGPWGSGYATAGLLMKWEFDFFREFPDEFELWLSLCEQKDSHGKLDFASYKEALKNYPQKSTLETDDE